MRRRLDIAVAGCGPAGLAAALLLARGGHRVTIFERFEAPRPLGSGLMIQPTGLAVLRALGLEADTLIRGARIDRLSGQTAGSARTVLDVRYAALGHQGAFGIGLHRASLFDLLYRAATAAGVALETGRPVERTVAVRRGQRRLIFADRDTAGPFDLVVDALGAHSPLAAAAPSRNLAYGALWASLDWPSESALDASALEQRYRRASVMAGVMPVGRPPDATKPQAAFFWSLRADRLEAWRRTGLAAWKGEVEALWPATRPLLDQIVDMRQLTFARYLHRTLAAPVDDALVHIGDAWHATSPQLGQGANMALLDAFALAAAIECSSDVAAALAQAVAWRRGHVRLYQAMSRVFTPVYQSDGSVLPWLRDWLVGPLSALWPASALQAAMVSGLVGAPLRRLGL